ncbi:unnamed protein product [Bursaphelenchus xylophilus]|uniref:(pine wood nematode) hypothetical protein n=1 Tax=Bursaphelenchus xylophilus TaxID=6326 RepID=A0A1I7S4V6_BURXY|nr:unnamed protein product [Bursaphelenchus xylophilus]CAG9117411.1 unnamed protein product [Bursaphelenchus xylophilus]
MVDSTGVRVAIRVRPQNGRETAAGYQICTMVSMTDPQIFMGNDKSFTYDFVFDRNSTQEQVYQACIRDLVEGVFKGYNATILAYGQTGSGKTHTMGTAFDAVSASVDSEHAGVIPRAAQQLFDGMESRRKHATEAGDPEPTFTIRVQFIELYNEDLIDLLSPDRHSGVKIHEDRDSGQIVLQNATTMQTNTPIGILEILRNGALNRKVASTNMNKESSRSHAIFSVHIQQDCLETIHTENGEEKLASVISAKLHFVDLAGSERLKRTGATGERAKEGICINCGLLALGNVINALTDPKKGHVPYRDSKLTRLLQDSLGGNSRTLMIACASPNDVDFAETLNTLNYASRTKAIKNKVVANKDHGSAMVGQLRAKIIALENELNEYRSGKRVAGGDADDNGISDQYYENVHLQAELQRVTVRAQALQESNNALTERVTRMKEQMEKEKLMKLVPTVNDDGTINEHEQNNFEATLSTIIETYVSEIEQLKSRLGEEMSEKDEYRKKLENLKRRVMDGEIHHTSIDSIPMSPMIENQLITSARKEIEDQKKLLEIYKERAEKEGVPFENSEMDDEPMDYDRESTPEEGTSEVDELDEEAIESRGNHAKLCLEVADLQNEIGTKEKLIKELELAERRLAQVRKDYERKLNELSDRIAATEAERDKILMDISKKPANKASEAKVAEVKKDYEMRLNSMKGEFSKLKMAQREHERLRQRQLQQQRDLERTKNELQEMKRSKVKLVQQMREEAKRVKKAEAEAAKKIAAMEKANRVKENKLRNLEVKDRQREEFMRRKMEQLNTLTSKQRTPLSSNMNRQRYGLLSKKPFSPSVAKNKWRQLESKINSAVSEHAGLVKLDGQHTRLLVEKGNKENILKDLSNKFVKARTIEERESIQEQMNIEEDHLNYINEQIKDVRAAMVDLEGVDKENGSNCQGDLRTVINQCENLLEARFLLDEMATFAVASAAAWEKSKVKIREMEAKLAEMEDGKMESDRLVNNLILSQTRHPEDLERDLSDFNDTPKRTSVVRQSLKARRRTQTTDELLYADRTLKMDQTVCLGQGGLQTTIIREEPDERSSPESVTDNGDIAYAQSTSKIQNVGVLAGHTRTVVSVDLCSTHGVSAGKDRKFFYWDIETAKAILTMNDFPKPMGGCRFMPCNSSLVLCAASFTIQVWDVRSNVIASYMNSSGIDGKGGFTIPGKPPRGESFITPLGISECGNYMATTFHSGARIWDLRTQRCISLYNEINKDRYVSDMLPFVSENYSYLLVGDTEGNIISNVLDADLKKKQYEPIDLHPQMHGRVVKMVTSQSQLYAISKHGDFWSFHLGDLTRDRVCPSAHDDVNVGDMCLIKNHSHNGELLATADYSGGIRIWSTENTSSFKLLDEHVGAHNATINEIASSDRGILATAADETVKLWRPEL